MFPCKKPCTLTCVCVCVCLFLCMGAGGTGPHVFRPNNNAEDRPPKTTERANATAPLTDRTASSSGLEDDTSGRPRLITVNDIKCECSETLKRN